VSYEQKAKPVHSTLVTVVSAADSKHIDKHTVSDTHTDTKWHGCCELPLLPQACQLLIHERLVPLLRSSSPAAACTHLTTSCS
jgi:hypothetical protein